MKDFVLDLSHHNNVSSFWDIKRSGVEGIIHKASEGALFVDKEYVSRERRARTTGTLWGAYHFGTGANAEKQVDHFLKQVGKNLDPEKAGQGVTTLLCLDWEGNPNGATMTIEGAETFVSEIRERTGRWPVLYSGQEFLRLNLAGRRPCDTQLSHCPLWIARYSARKPILPIAFSKWWLWQYTSSGTCPGVEQRNPAKPSLDRNKFEGNVDDLRSFWRNAGR